MQPNLKYGVGLPDDHLVQMFHNILPEHVVKEVRAQREWVTLHQQINWLQVSYPDTMIPGFPNGACSDSINN